MDCENKYRMKQKALFLSHIDIFPVISGDRVRLSQQLARLIERFDVDTVEITHNKNALPAKVFNSSIGESKIFFINKRRRYLCALKTIFNHKLEMVNHYLHKEVVSYIDGIAGRYDLIFCGSPAMAMYALKSDRYKLLDMTDSLSMNYDRLAKTLAFPRNMFYGVEKGKMRRFERLCRDNFDKVAYISDNDRRYVDYRLEKSVVVGNSVEIPPLHECNSHNGNSLSVTFVGMMRYVPNMQAADYLARKLMPEVLKVYHDAHLKIVGANPDRSVMALADKNITVTGYVDSLIPYYRDCSLFVAPMLSGSGIQNKIIQAMSYGCCVVTTPFGAEGISCGEEALVVREPGSDFNRTVIELLRDRGKRCSIGQKAREYIAETLSEEVISKQFEEFLLD